jgi:YVTN family beta-propeller protein
LAALPRNYYRTVVLFVLINGAFLTDLRGQRIIPPRRPNVEPFIGRFYAHDSNGDRIEDALSVRSGNMAQQIRKALTVQQQQTVRAQLDKTVKIELLFDRPITQRQIDTFESLGGEISHVYKAVSYGWNGRVRLSQIEIIAERMGDSLVLVEENKPVELHLRLATQTGRVRPVWANGFAGSVNGYEGDSSISIAILDTGVDGSHTDLAGRAAFWHDYTSDAEPNAVDIIQHGSHVAGIALGKGASLGTETTLYYTDSGNLIGISEGSFFPHPIDFPPVATTWNATATWWGGDVGTFHYVSSPLGADSWASESSISSASPLSHNDSFTVSSSKKYTAALLSNGVMDTYTISNSLTNFSPLGDGFATLRGVAPGCQWVGAKVFSNDGAGSGTDIGSAVDDMVALRDVYNIKIMNLSLGFSGDPGLSPTLRQKINTAAWNGILPVISAGNDGPGGEVDDPGRAALALTVGAANDINELTEYSSRGFTSPVATVGQEEDHKPDLLAPGGSDYYSLIMSVDSNHADGGDVGFPDVQNNDYYNIKGTSMAAPFAAGCAALVIEALQTTSNLTGTSWDFSSGNDVGLVKMLLCATATETNADREAGTGINPTLDRAANGSGGFPAGKDMFEGYGLLNVDAAIEGGTLEYTIGSEENAALGGDVFSRRAWARKVSLTDGQNMNLLLSAPGTGDFDIYLFSMTPTAFGTPTLLASSTNAGLEVAEFLHYVPSASGEGLIVVKRVSGAGVFTLFSDNDSIPPVASSASVSTPLNTPIPITLTAMDDGQPNPPGMLTYIISDLPSHGILEDPGAGQITEPNTPLVLNGNQVIYTPDFGYVGSDEFSFQADDEGTSPLGGISNIAIVSLAIKSGLLSEDFEIDIGQFTIDNTWGIGNGLWHVTSVCASDDPGLLGHTRPTSLYYGLDSNCNFDAGVANEGVVTSDPIDLTDYEAPIELTCNYFLETEGAPSGWDVASVEVVANGWDPNVVASNNAGGELLLDPSESWQSLRVDLSRWAGLAIRIRFHFDTEDNVINTYAGFYVDDVILTGTKKQSPPTAWDQEVAACQDSSELIPLFATDDGRPAPLTYSIESLPAHGVLADPNAGVIIDPSTALVEAGTGVIYTPAPGYSGPDEFIFRVDDGGSLPDGGKSNFAVVSIEVQAFPPEPMRPDPNHGVVEVPLDTILSWNGAVPMGPMFSSTRALNAITAVKTQSDSLSGEPVEMESGPVTEIFRPSGASPTQVTLSQVYPNLGGSTLSSKFIGCGVAPEGDTPMGVAFTPDGAKIVVAHCDSRNLVVFDSNTREVLQTIAISGSANALAISADGQYALTANVFEDTVSIVNLSLGKEIAVVAVGDQPGALKITSDGTTAVVGNTLDGDLSIIDIATATERKRIPGVGFAMTTTWSPLHGGTVYNFSSFEIMPDNRTIIMPDQFNNCIHLINLADGTVHSLSSDPWPCSVAITPDGTKAIVGHNGSTRLLSVLDPNQQIITKTIPTGADVDGSHFSIAIHPSGIKAVVPVQNAVRVVNLITDTVSGDLNTSNGSVVSVTADGQYCLAGGYNGSLISFDTESILKHLNMIHTAKLLAISPTESRAVLISNTAGEDMLVLNTDGVAGHLEARVPTGPFPEGDKARSVAFSPDGAQAVVVNILSGNVTLMDLEFRTVAGTIAVGDWPLEAEITPDNASAVVGNFESPFVSVIDLATQAVTNINISDSQGQVEIAPDGKYAYVSVIAADGVWRIDLDSLSVAGGKLVTGNMGTFGYHFNQSSGMTLSHDGATLVTCNSFDDNISIIDVAFWTEVVRVPVGDFPVRAIFSADDSAIYICNRDSDTISVVGNNGAASSVTDTIAVGDLPFELALTPDGSTLYVADYRDNQISVVNLSQMNVVDRIILSAPPIGLAVDSKGEYLYAVVNGADFFVIDVNDSSIVNTLDTGLAPAMLAYHDERRLIAIPSPMGADGLTLIDLDECPERYDVYFGTENPPNQLMYKDLTEPYFEPNIPLLHGTSYYWQVAAKNCCGRTYGEVWSFTTETCLETPFLLEEPVFTGGSCNTVSWIAIPGADDYRVECAVDPDFSVVVGDSGWVPDTEHTFCNLTSGQTYWYRVKARKTGICETPWSNIQVSLQCGTPGDFEPDCDVDLVDLMHFLNHWLQSGCDDSANDDSDWCYGADLNRDHEVNLEDMAILAQHWLEDFSP